MTAPTEPRAAGDPRLNFLNEVEQRARSLRQRGREITGTGGREDPRPFRRLLREEGVSLYPMVAIASLGLSQQLHLSAAMVTHPDIARTFGLSPMFFTVTTLMAQAIAVVIPLATARYVQNRARRAQVMLVSAAVFALCTPLTGLVTTVSMLLALAVADTMTTSAHATVSTALMIDLYPPQVRVRVVSVLTATGTVAGLAVTGLIAALVALFDLNWRGIYVALGALAVLFWVVAVGLRDPGFGHHDTELLRDEIRRTADPARSGPDARVGAPAPTGTRLSMSEAIRRIWQIKTMRLTLIASVVASLGLPASIYLQFHLANRFSLGVEELAWLGLLTGAVGLCSYLVLAPISDRIFQRNPARMFYLAGVIGLLSIPLGYVQVFATSVPMLFLLSMVGPALSGMFGPAMMVGSMSIVPAALRPHVGGVSALFALGGYALGTALMGGIASGLGVVGALLVISVFSAAGTVVGMMAGRGVRGDLDSMIEEVLEEEAVRQLRREGAPIPMIALRGVDFAYGTSKVLFDVNVSVEDGEMVALLGVNGAGKSTLLRVLSGLGIPQRGSVRLDGQDITHLDAHRRARLGITQVPGGRAVFGDLTVAENLRCYGYAIQGKRELGRRIDDAFTGFPRLADRRNALASTLSGGEQQMLGLAKAFVMRPRLLVIDELTLGLAPLVVEELLAMVRTINTQGASVVLVEQSVNIALSITDHAYFMEQGQIRFDGSSSRLLEQTDLLRSVFLSGVAGARA